MDIHFQSLSRADCLKNELTICDQVHKSYSLNFVTNQPTAVILRWAISSGICPNNTKKYLLWCNHPHTRLYCDMVRGRMLSLSAVSTYTA